MSAWMPLTAFRFSLKDRYLGPTPEDPTVSFKAYLMAWDPSGQHATGNALYQSATRTSIQDDAINVFVFEGLDIPLAPGPHVAFLLLPRGMDGLRGLRHQASGGRRRGRG